MWLQALTTLPGTNGSHWWRRQDPHNLWWQFWRGKLPYPTEHLGENHSSYGYGLHAGLHAAAPSSSTSVSSRCIGEGATASGVASLPRGESTWLWPTPGTTLLLLKADVSKAHRRIKILPSGWKYQVAQIDQQWWVNKVGTYGVASAQLYWGRLAALLLRLLYWAFPEVDWGFVFVDDFCFCIFPFSWCMQTFWHFFASNIDCETRSFRAVFEQNPFNVVNRRHQKNLKV